MKTIEIHRKLPFNQEQQDEINDWFADASVGIGSYFLKVNSYKIESGLSETEEQVLLPSIIGVSPKEFTDYKKARDLFYSDINTDVPQKIGIKLNISLQDNEKPFGAKMDIAGTEVYNLPENPMDYIRYKHALGHPWVAKSKEEADSSSHKYFYILDKDSTMKKQLEINNMKDKALQEYLSIKDNTKKVGMVLTLLGERVKELGEPVTKLREISDKEPKRFLSVVGDKNLEAKYEIKEMISKNVLRTEGIFILISDSGEKIGGSLDEAVLWMNDKKNSKESNVLKARLEEFSR